MLFTYYSFYCITVIVVVFHNKIMWSNIHYSHVFLRRRLGLFTTACLHLVLPMSGQVGFSRKLHPLPCQLNVSIRPTFSREFIQSENISNMIIWVVNWSLIYKKKLNTYLFAIFFHSWAFLILEEALVDLSSIMWRDCAISSRSISYNI